MIIKNGQPYQINGNGKVIKLSDEFTVPFADVHFANFKKVDTFKDIDSTAELDKAVQSRVNYYNIFFAVKVHGQFSKITTRSVYRQKEPYPPLNECADSQHVFHGSNKTGTIIGYYSPQIFNGPAVGGYHLHFLADDLSMGGHILGFNLSKGVLSLQPFSNLNQQNPIHDQKFMNHDFSKDKIEESIDHSEGEH